MSMLELGDVGHGIVLAILILLVIVLLNNLTRSKPRRSYPFPYRPARFDRFPNPFQLIKFDQRQTPDLTDVGQQLNAVMAASFEKRRVLSTSEYRVFAIIEGEIAAQRAGYRVFAQTSLGEILRSSNQDAFRSINSKRVDILVIDRSGWPFLAVEFQGDGHYQGTAAARDAVKKEALRKAGVKHMEFSATDTDAQIKSRLRELFVSKVVAAARN